MGIILLLGLIVIPGIVWGWHITVTIVAGIVIFGVLFAVLRGMAAQGAEILDDELSGRLHELYRQIVARHAEPLQRKKVMLVSHDDYGNRITARWDAELSYFYQTVVAGRLTDGTLSLSTYDQTRMKALATEAHFLAWVASADAVPDGLPAALTPDAGLSPVEYEHWCKEKLAAYGWQARVTVASGDQGADVLAERDGQKLVIQCKLYSSPVGNKAVQEVMAAKIHYRCDMAAVVSNQPYTRSAGDLARSAGVLLLHHSELGRFAPAGHVEMDEENADRIAAL